MSDSTGASELSAESESPPAASTPGGVTAEPVHIHGIEVFGVGVKPETRCAHYGTPLDVIAIRFACCDRFYPCHRCHEAVADHAARVWPASSLGEPVVLCGACGHVLTAREYLASGSQCTQCETAFNPGCARHRDLYFAPEATAS